MIGQAEQADLGLVPAVGDSADDPLFHDLFLVAHDGALARGIARLDKTRQDPQRHLLGHGQLHRPGLQDLGAQGGHLQHLLVGDARQLPGPGLDAGVGGVDPIDVRVDVASHSPHRSGDRHGAGVGSASAQGRDPA